MTLGAEPTLDVKGPPPGMIEGGRFAGRVMGDLAAAMAGVLCAIGHRLGLFRGLAREGPATPGELAERADVDVRYAEEWLRGLAAAGYLDFDASSDRFTLPPGRAEVLAREGGPLFLGGGHLQMAALAGMVEALGDAFRSGEGVAQEAYPGLLFEGMERMSATWFENLLTTAWLGALPALRERLELGAAVADVGCGHGRAVVALAREFPNSRFVGYDAFGAAVERARENAGDAGVAEIVDFEVLDVADGLPEGYDLITAFDAAHDFPDPVAAFTAIREALHPGGTHLLLETDAPERGRAAEGPAGTILYATSLLYTLPVARANGGGGGALGLPETRIRELCGDAGFGGVRRIPTGDPFHALFEVTP